jgi:hypothetical protein
LSSNHDICEWRQGFLSGYAPLLETTNASNFTPLSFLLHNPEEGLYFQNLLMEDDGQALITAIQSFDAVAVSEGPFRVSQMDIRRAYQSWVYSGRYWSFRGWAVIILL